MSPPTNVAIVGGGITGLSLAHYLIQRPGARVRLIEATSRLGGWIRTEEIDSNAGPIRYETGPRSLNRIRGQLTLQLCDELDLAYALRPASAISQQRFIVGRDRRLQALPSTPWAMLRSELTRHMPRWLIRDLVWPRPVPDRDLTMDEFFRVRLGPEAADMLASSLAAGIYAGDSIKLSMRSCLPSLIQSTIEHGSMVRGLIRASITKPDPGLEQSPNWERIQQRLGRAPMYSFDGGLSTLVDALERHLRPTVPIEINLKVVRLCPRTLSVQTSDGRNDQFDHIFWTGSASALASVLSPTDDAIRSLQTSLTRIRYASIACVTLIWNHEVTMAQGFGVLVPSCVNDVPPVLGITFDSQTFPIQSRAGTTVMTVMIGGDRDPELAHASSSDLVELAMRAARDLLGVVHEADMTAVSVAQDAIPQFYLGHGDIVQEIVTGAARLNPGFHIVGTAVSGVAINDCIRAGWQACADFHDHVEGSNVFHVQK